MRDTEFNLCNRKAEQTISGKGVTPAEDELLSGKRNQIKDPEYSHCQEHLLSCKCSAN